MTTITSTLLLTGMIAVAPRLTPAFANFIAGTCIILAIISIITTSA
jgi:hypothetical protein